MCLHVFILWHWFCTTRVADFCSKNTIRCTKKRISAPKTSHSKCCSFKFYINMMNEFLLLKRNTNKNKKSMSFLYFLLVQGIINQVKYSQATYITHWRIFIYMYNLITLSEFVNVMTTVVVSRFFTNAILHLCPLLFLINTVFLI